MDDGRRLTVLITNITLTGRTGTEIYTRNLAAGLMRRGHHPIVYSPNLGPIADELRRLSIPVVSDINKVGKTIDIVHGHHTPVTAVAVSRFPEAAALFIAHDFTAWFDTPPMFPSIRRYLAVDATVADRLISQHGFKPAAVEILMNAVDMTRFLPGPPLPDRPRRALAIAKNLGHLEPIEQACATRGIELDAIGQAVGRVIDAPETMLPDYDLVFTSAMSALEAMACGRAVISCDGRGLAGLISPARYDVWRPLNFGLRTLQRRVTVEAIQGEIDRYDAEAASAISARVRAEAGIDAWLDRIVQYYHACIKEHHSMPSTREHWSRSTARYLQDWRPRINDQWPWLEEWQQLREKLDNAALQQDAPILGVTVPFASCDDKHPTPVTLRGFSVLEEWGRWTDGDEAILMTRLPHLSDKDLLVRFDVRAFLAPPAPCLDVEVIVNGTPLANWHFDLDDPTTLGLREVPLSSSITGKLDVVWFHFRINKAKSPMELRMSDDPRRLGIGFVSLTFERATPPIR